MVSVRLDDTFVADVKICASNANRSVPKQIEHWAKIGRMCEDNPDLTYRELRNLMYPVLRIVPK